MIFGSIRTIHTLGIPTAIASRSLSPGCGRTNNLDVTVHRSPSTIDTSTIPPTPTVIVSEPMTHSPAPQTAEEGIRKEPGQDGKDAVYEFSCSEKRLSAQPILFVQLKHTFPLLFCVAVDVLPASFKICVFRAHTFIQQGDLHSTVQ
ncbi:hypothetical protein BDR07DRAFT_1483987 [Suillus spraguei]|nr:hypothetical protein BDR07DRAFT_1483987 [Suillus spraguei]